MNKHQRIKKNTDFQKVFKRGKSFANRQFVVYLLPNADIETYRVGLSVSKKLGNAVKRNQIKRYIRQSILEMNDEIKPHTDYVIIARNPASTMNFHEVKKSLTHVLRVAKAIKPTKQEE